MPKLKTKRAAAKRFHATGTGKLKRFKAYEKPYSDEEDHEEKAQPAEEAPSRNPANPKSHEKGFAVSIIVFR